MKLDIDFIFDGVSDGKKLRSSFAEACKLVAKRKYRSSPQDRAKMLDLQLFSDFLSGGARGKQFAPALFGFTGEPKNLSRYASPESAPDVELTVENLNTLFGEEIASQFGFDPTVTSTGNRTLEIKQKLSAGGTTTFTQLGAGPQKEFAGSIAKVRGQATVKQKLNSKGKPTIKASLFDQDKLFRWFESSSQAKYREALITQFEQKMQNYLLFSYADGKFKALAVPGLAKKFNLRAGAARRRELLTLEFTGGATGGSIALRTSTKGNALIKKLSIDVTNQIAKAAEKKFLQNILQFYIKGAGAKVLARTGQNTKYGFVNAFAELLLIANEFGRLPASFKFQDSGLKAGAIKSRARTPEPARQTKSEKQRLVTEIQLTALAQRALQQRMPQGQPGGPPDPTPGILTSRTGRFIQSAQVLKINERKRTIFYTYDPIYRVHEEKYKPTELVTNTIREVAQQQFGVRYALFRR